MEKIKLVVAGVRTRLHALYENPSFGNLLPTRQVLSAGAAALAATFLDEVVPGLEVSDALLSGTAAAVVAYLVGPPKVGDPETHQLVPVGGVVTLATEEDVALEGDVAVAAEAIKVAGGGALSLPEVEGEFVGPENDDTEPGKIV